MQVIVIPSFATLLCVLLDAARADHVAVIGGKLNARFLKRSSVQESSSAHSHLRPVEYALMEASLFERPLESLYFTDHSSAKIDTTSDQRFMPQTYRSHEFAPFDLPENVVDVVGDVDLDTSTPLQKRSPGHGHHGGMMGMGPPGRMPGFGKHHGHHGGFPMMKGMHGMHGGMPPPPMMGMHGPPGGMGGGGPPGGMMGGGPPGGMGGGPPGGGAGGAEEAAA